MDFELRELQLRAHIRGLLLSYAKTHLTRDYKAFTESAVPELLSRYLSFVPTNDPHSVTLPEDSFDVLTRTLGLRDLEPYDEKLPTDRKAIELLRNTLVFQGKPRSESCWGEKDSFDYSTSIYRPWSPILTTRAIRNTPKMGSGAALKSVPKSLGNTLKTLTRVHPEIMEELPPIKLEDALNLRPSMDSATHSSMLSLLRTVPGVFASIRPQVHSHVANFLRSDSPPPKVSLPEFVPIFARCDRLGGGQTQEAVKPVHSSIPNALSDLPSMLPEPAPAEDEYKDLYKQHMVVVDGWQTIAPSSPSSIGTPSLGSGTSEVDELFLMSPPENRPALIQELMAAKIDETEIPRSQKIGGATKKSKPIGSGQSLGSFLSPFVSGPSAAKEEVSCPHIVTTPRSSPRSAIGLSVLGQPSSLHEVAHPSQVVGKNAADDNREMDLDLEVGRIYADVHGSNSADLILNERLNEKDGMLMDVPNMPQPTEHALTTMFLPTTLRGLVPTSIKAEGDGTPCLLKKVSGLKSLNMELSWRPFQYGPNLPTHEELAKIEGGFRDSELAEFNDVDSSKVDALLGGAAVLSNGTDDRRSFRGWDDDFKPSILAQAMPFEIMLTAKERRRLAGTQSDLEDDDSDLDEAVPVTYEAAASRDENTSTEHKEPHLKSPCPANFAKHEEFESLFDDSGVSFAHPIDVHGTDDYDDQEQFGDEMPQDADKENVPPMLDYPVSQHSVNAQQAFAEEQDRVSLEVQCVDDAAHGSFVPLSFDSQYDRSTYPSNAALEPLPVDYSGSHYVDYDALRSSPQQVSIGEDPTKPALDLPEHFMARSHSSDPPPDFSKSSTSTTFIGQSLAEFLNLRNRSTTTEIPSARVLSQATEYVSASIPEIRPLSPLPVVPENILDHNTLLLPSPWLMPSTVHRYLSSMDLIQKRSIVRLLAHQDCAVQLVERDTLGGVDLILDPHTAIILIRLVDLPSQCESLTARLGQQSWRYSSLLVIFEAFPVSLAYRLDQTPRLAPSAYTPHALKAIKKLRRDLGITEACGSKNAQTSIRFAFADSVKEVAFFIRYFGDCAEANDMTGGAIWGVREWLDVEEQEDEQDLANMDGMNVFAAFVILCQRPLQDFLNLTAEEREHEFSTLVGGDRIVLFNQVLESRYETMLSSISSSSEI